MLLAAALIVRDEEARLGGALRSIQSFVDEIVVVDTGSTDRTVPIAESFGARIIHDPWRDDFSYARNVSLAACRAPWALVIDADERFVGDGGALRAELSAPDCNAVMLTVENIDADGSILSDLLAPRVFLAETYEYVGRVHNNLVTRAGCTRNPGRSDAGKIVHLGYAPELYAARGKFERTERLLKMAMIEEPENPRNFCYLGKMYAFHGRPAESLPILDEILGRMSAAASARFDLGSGLSVLAEAYATKAAALAALDAPRAEIERVLLAGIEACPASVELRAAWFNLDEGRRDRGRSLGQLLGVELGFRIAE